MELLRPVVLALTGVIMGVWPKSLGELVALNHDVLPDWVCESNPFMSLMGTFVSVSIPFDRLNLPWSGVSNGQVYEFFSPVLKRSVKDTIIRFSEVCLLFESWSP